MWVLIGASLFLKSKNIVTSTIAHGLLHYHYELWTANPWKKHLFLRWFSYLEFAPRTPVDIWFHSQQFQVLTKDPLVHINDTSCALDTFSDSGLYKLTFYITEITSALRHQYHTQNRIKEKLWSTLHSTTLSSASHVTYISSTARWRFSNRNAQ